MTRQKNFVSLFHHIFITIWQNKILWSSLALKDSYMTILFNKWSQSDKNVMKMWWLEISTYFLVHIIGKFPPLQNLMSDARCLDVDACLSAPIELLPRNRIANEEALALIEKLSTMLLMLMTSAAIFRLRKYELRGMVWKTVQGRTDHFEWPLPFTLYYLCSLGPPPRSPDRGEISHARGAFPCPKVVEQ